MQVSCSKVTCWPWTWSWSVLSSKGIVSQIQDFQSYSCSLFILVKSDRPCHTIKVYLLIYVVIQFYPWLNFYFPLFLGMVMYDNEFKRKGIKNYTKHKTEPQQIHPMWLSLKMKYCIILYVWLHLSFSRKLANAHVIMVIFSFSFGALQRQTFPRFRAPWSRVLECSLFVL